MFDENVGFHRYISFDVLLTFFLIVIEFYLLKQNIVKIIQFKNLSNFLSVWRIKVPEGRDGLLTDVILCGSYSVQKYQNSKKKNISEGDNGVTVTEKEYENHKKTHLGEEIIPL